MSTAQPTKAQIAFAFALVYVFWGSTYLAIGVAVKHVPPAVMAGVRFLISGPLMLLWCWWSGRKIGLTRTDAVRLAAIGVLLLTGGNLALAWAEKYVATGLAALIVAVVPIWVAILEAWFFRSDRLAGRGIFGLLLGIVGLTVLVWPSVQNVSHSTQASMQFLGSMALLAGSFSWALGSVLSRRWQLGVGPFAATAWEMTFAGIVNTGIALALGDFARADWNTASIGSIAYLVTAGSWIGFTAYIWLLEHVPTPKVATYAYVNPVVAVFLGWLVLHERVDAFILWGTLIIVAAVVLVTTSRLQKSAAPAADCGKPGLPPCEEIG